MEYIVHEYVIHGYGICKTGEIPPCWGVAFHCCDAPGAGDTDGRQFFFQEEDDITIHGKLSRDSMLPGFNLQIRILVKNGGETVINQLVDVDPWCGQFRLDIPAGTLRKGIYTVKYEFDTEASAYVFLTIKTPPPPPPPPEEDYILVENIVFSDYYTYRGPAVEFNTEWTSPLDLIFDTHQFIMNLLKNITEQFKQVTTIQVLLWRRQETFYGIPYYHYKMKLYAHDSPIDPATLSAILSIIYVAVIAIAAWVILNQFREIIWGPKEVPWWVRIILPASIGIIAVAYAVKTFRKK